MAHDNFVMTEAGTRGPAARIVREDSAAFPPTADAAYADWTMPSGGVGGLAAKTIRRRDSETSRRIAMVVIAKPARPAAINAISEPSSSATLSTALHD